MYYNFLAITETTKQFLMILAISLLILVVLLGLIVKTIDSSSKEKAKEIDLYLTDMCRFQILKTPEEVVKYTKKREFKSFLNKNKWFLRVFLLILIVFFVLMRFCFNNNYNEVNTIIYDLTFKLESPRSKFYFFNNFPTDWPVLTKASVVHPTFMGYSVYVLLIVSLLTLIILLINSIELIYKLRRSKKIKTSVFGKTIQ